MTAAATDWIVADHLQRLQSAHVAPGHESDLVRHFLQSFNAGLYEPLTIEASGRAAYAAGILGGPH